LGFKKSISRLHKLKEKKKDANIEKNRENNCDYDCSFDGFCYCDGISISSSGSFNWWGTPGTTGGSIRCLQVLLLTTMLLATPILAPDWPISVGQTAIQRLGHSGNTRSQLLNGI
jgi:hypothetical protein